MIWREILVRHGTNHFDCGPNDSDHRTTYSEADEHVVFRVFDSLRVQVIDATEVSIEEHFRELQLLDSLDESFRPHAAKILVTEARFRRPSVASSRGTSPTTPQASVQRTTVA